MQRQKYYVDNLERLRAKTRQQQRGYRQWLLEIIGDRCESCGKTDHLHVEHRNGGGTAERRAAKSASVAERYWRFVTKEGMSLDEVRARLGVACDWCNYLKGTRTQEEWRQLVHSGAITEYAERLKKICPHNSTNGKEPQT